MLKVLYGQDPYSVIGKYIREHITAIEDIIAVIKIDNITTNQLFMVDMNEENYFIWNDDWYEGEKDVALIDFFPVSEAINPSAQPMQWIPLAERLPEEGQGCLVCDKGSILIDTFTGRGNPYNWKWYVRDYEAWMPLPEPYREDDAK